jgi:hypothetical protein
MEQRTSFAVEWLLQSNEPGIVVATLCDLLDDGSGTWAEGPLVAGLLEGQNEDGGFGSHPYRKWTGAHWRLVSLVELGLPPGDHRGLAAAGTVLDWLSGERHRSSVPVIDGLARRCASQEGNALAVCSRLGLAGDERVQTLARSLVGWQWPDGGWNCDTSASGRRSSFHETLPAMWGLHEYATVTGDAAAALAARSAAELLLSHRLFRSLRSGEVIHRSWITLHHPVYWHYDVLQALLVLSRMGLARDERCVDALDLLERRRLPDGRWRPGAYWWNRPGSERAPEAVDWGRSGPNRMITLNALRALRAAGRV